MVQMRDYKPPVNVSPLIKFSRWSFLLLGVTYGAVRHSWLQRREDNVRETKQKEREIRNARIAEEKQRAKEAEMADLSKTFGTKFA